MAKLAPLAQWYCDVCEGIIESCDEGYVVWRSEGSPAKAHSFLLIHQGRCDLDRRNSSLALRDLLGVPGLVRWLAKIDKGAFHESHVENGEPPNGPHVRDTAEWAEMVRRLYLPYYEEARRHLVDASSDGWIGGANEVGLYMPESLLRLINRYG